MTYYSYQTQKDFNTMKIVEIEGKIFLNDKEILPHPNGEVYYFTVAKGKVYCDGYEWTGEEWKRTLKALYHKYF